MASIQHVSDTYATVIAVANHGARSAREVRIWNGDTTVLLSDGSTQPICGGDTECSSTKVASDTDVDALESKALNALVAGKFITDDDAKGYFTHKKELAAPTEDAKKMRRLLKGHRAGGGGRRLFVNYGCCSMAASFLLGGKDSADCGSSLLPDGTYSIPTGRHNGKGPSKSCEGHDFCLHRCGGGGCKCWGDCDWELYKSVKKSSCRWWDCACKVVRFAIKTHMKKKPNGCDGMRN